MWDPYAEFESVTLPNGLTVYAAEWTGRPWEAIGFLIHSGAEQDPIGKEGLAHYVEHMVSANTILPYKELNDFFENHGGRVYLGGTGYQFTKYNFFMPIEKSVFSQALFLFGNMLLSSRLTTQVERERQVIVGEFNEIYPEPIKLELDMREQKTLHRGHFLERFVTPLGNPESVRSITQEEIQRSYDRHYTPRNMSIIGVGGLSIQELVDHLLDSPFANEKSGERTPLPNCLSDVDAPMESRYEFRMSERTSILLNTGVYRSVCLVPGAVKEEALRAIGNMLNHVLTVEIREKRAWTYGVRTNTSSFGYYSEFSINAAISLDALDYIEAEVESCIESLASRGDLFEEMKQKALMSLLMTDATGQEVRDNVLDDVRRYGKIVTLGEIKRELEKTTMGDVREALKWFTSERRHTMLIRP